jgi:AcrR family transcriptional regulator
MVVTPWGESDSLRDRMLRRGPGTPPEKVAENQRMRLFGAMVACVSRQGYAATTVADLTRTSGVSRRSFYDLFDDKEACFVSTLEAILEGAMGLVLPEDQEGSWEDRARRDFHAFTRSLAAQTAASKVCLVDAYAAGPRAVELVEKMVVAGETLLRQRYDESPDRSGLPPEIFTAMVGGVLEIFRRRVRVSDPDPGTIGEDLLDLAFSYRSPARPLKRRGGTINPSARAPEPWDQAARALLAFEEEVAEKGYVRTTVEEVAARAGMSVKTVYANFSGKEDLLGAAIDSGAAQIAAAVLPAFRRNPYWPEQVRGALTAFFGFLASRPTLAKVMLIEVLGAGQGALQQRQAALSPLESLLAEGPRQNAKVPRVAAEAILAGILSMAARRVREKGPQDLPGLVQVATYLALAPFLGEEEATAAALAERDNLGAGVMYLKRTKTLQARQGMEAILTALSQKALTATAIAAETGETLAETREQLEKMLKTDLVQPAESSGDEDPDEPHYVTTPAARLFETDTWSGLPSEEKNEISRAIHQLVGAEVDLSLEKRAFDARDDRHLVRAPLFLDAEGWREVDQILDGALDAVLKARDRSAERLRKSGEAPLETRLAYYFFEMPDS